MQQVSEIRESAAEQGVFHIYGKLFLVAECLEGVFLLFLESSCLIFDNAIGPARGACIAEQQIVLQFDNGRASGSIRSKLWRLQFHRIFWRARHREPSSAGLPSQLDMLDGQSHIPSAAVL